MIHSFASDNFAGVHPDVMAAIQGANVGHAIAYGADPWTERSDAVFKKVFGAAAESYIVFNGTGANVAMLKHLFSSWQAVICSSSSHLWTDECGAPSGNTGCSLLLVKEKNGKITPEGCKKFLSAKGSQHNMQPAAISIAQSTELGTVYSIEEMKELVDFAHENDLLFHVDGARLCNAAASLNVSLKALTTDIGVDVVSFGGTKNGLMGAEAVVFLKEGLGENFKYVRKQGMQLASKMRFLSAQMIALLEGDLWLRNAMHANKMAKLMESKLREHCFHAHILYPVQANAVFAHLPSMEILLKLQQKSFFWIWNQEGRVARWMTSWDTQPAFVEEFVAELKKLLG